MKDHRHGDQLWEEWTGNGYEKLLDGIVYFTHPHVSLDEDVVKRALASALQRDGVADSLGIGFKMVEFATISYQWSGYVSEEMQMSFCDESGETFYGDSVEVVFPTTFVEIDYL